MAVKTGWVRIGRSGETIDGRVIEPEWLTQAADNYDKEFFSAPVWPGHSTWYRLGTVLTLKAESNTEGGVDLYAIIEPNEYYRQSVKAGQMLHTSMELRPNFRNSQGWYLQGLAATDEPASVATSEMKFSKQQDHAGSVFSDFVENKTHDFTDDNQDQPPRWFTNIFKNKPKEDAAMASQEFETLKQEIAALTAKFDASPSDDNTDDTDPSDDAVVALASKVDVLAQQVMALTETMANGDDPDDKLADINQFEAFQTELTALSEKLEAAINQQNGTDTPESTGGEDFQASAYQ